MRIFSSKSFYRANIYASTVFGVLILSACLHVVVCAKTKQRAADILIPHIVHNHSATLTPALVGGQRPFRLKFEFKATHLLRKTSTDFRLITSEL